MKTVILLLAITLMTATTMGQTSRREANNDLSVRNHESGVKNPKSNKSRSDVYYASPREFKGGREVSHHYPALPKTREYRRLHSPYPPPVLSFYWTPEVRYEYIRLYPIIGYSKYPVGYRIENVSAYDAMHFRGEVVNVYGKVFEVYYSRYTDEYIMYFGAYFPYHDFTAVIPGEIARRYSPWPERYFAKEHLVITGLVAIYEGVPEITVKAGSQIRLY